MEPSEKLLFTRAEAAEMLSLSVSTVDVAIARGMLRARRQGKRVLIERREVEKFSRADHPRIWSGDGNRGTRVEGRVCFDCVRSTQLNRTAVPAARFMSRLPLCQACFDRRKSLKIQRDFPAQNSHSVVAGPETCAPAGSSGWAQPARKSSLVAS
jgi:excisionase family DNA binding protein